MPILINKEYEQCLGGQVSIKIAHEIINKTTVKFFNECINGKVNEYQNFIKNENDYLELKEIDGDGEIKD